jgi:serine protease inhibitor
MGICRGVAATAVLLVAMTAGSLAQQTDVAAVAQANNAFALDLYGKLKAQKGNLFFSPYSISAAFAMTYTGARGETAAQMAKTMHFDLPQEKLHPAMKSFVAALDGQAKKGGYEFVVANALWGQKGYGFLPAFLKTTKDSYGASLSEVDFIRNTEGARKTINTWVEDKTKQKIVELIKRDMVTDKTLLVLTNAVYFKGNWASAFEKNQAQDAPFTLADGRKVTVPMMGKEERLYYSDTALAQVVAVPYRNGAFTMIIVLPKKVDGLREYEAQFNATSMAEGHQKRVMQRVHVLLPRFKVTSEFELNDAMKSLGMTGAFVYPGANFSGMNGRMDLFISKAIHKAYVDVNEEGTEAAAATAIVMMPGAAPPPAEQIVFRADHPFMFFLEESATGAILFMGRVMNPKE